MSDTDNDYFIHKTIVGLFLFIIFTCNIWHAEPTVATKLSNIFSFISSFGIVATVVVYIFQKNDIDKKDKKINNKIISHARIQLSYICYDFYQKISQIQTLSNFINKEYGAEKYQCNSSIYNLDIEIIANKHILNFNLKKEKYWGYSKKDIDMIKREKPSKFITYILTNFESNINQILKLNDTISTIDIKLSENINLALLEMRKSSTFLDNIIYQAGSNNFEYLNQACDSFLCNGDTEATEKREINNEPQHGFENIYNLIIKENLP